MQFGPMKLTIKVETGQNDINGSTFPSHPDNIKSEPHDSIGSSVLGHLKDTPQEPIDVTSLEEEEDHSTEDEDNLSCENAQNQLVVYDPSANSAGGNEAVTDPMRNQPPPFPRYAFPNQTARVLPSVGAFTVQCANCFKWRLIPTKEKYEEIREHILEQPFLCETAREWRPEISCDDPPDISQDGSRLWAIDKPNIAQPPPRWQRLLRIRGEGGTRFADVYYVAPSGKKLRSTVEIQKYLEKHPEYIEEGVRMSQFSFQIPRPLQENYVRKRPARMAALNDGSRLGMPESLEPSEVNPIAWADPDDNTELRLGRPGFYTPYDEASVSEPVNRPTKKKRTPFKQCNGDPAQNPW